MIFRRKKERVQAGRKKVSVAAFYENVTLREWCAWMQARTDIARVCAALSITEDEARELTSEQRDKVIRVFSHAISKPVASDFTKVELRGKQYRLIPDLTKITLGEHMDIVNNVQQGTIYTTLPKAMAILYRPVTMVSGKHYAVEAYDHKKHLSEENLDAILDMTMDVVEGASLFFSTISKELSANLELSLIKELKETTMEAMK